MALDRRAADQVLEVVGHLRRRLSQRRDVLCVEDAAARLDRLAGTRRRTLDAFESLVADGKIHWFIDGGGLGAQIGGTLAGDRPVGRAGVLVVDGTTVYDLTAPAA